MKHGPQETNASDLKSEETSSLQRETCTDEVQSMLQLLPLATDDTPWRSWKTVEWRAEDYLVPDQAF